MIHIDFGFLLGISPGNNMGFERAAFKYTNDMSCLMEDPHNKDGCSEFIEITIQGFLIARNYMDEIVPLVSRVLCCLKRLD